MPYPLSLRVALLLAFAMPPIALAEDAAPSRIDSITKSARDMMPVPVVNLIRLAGSGESGDDVV